MTDSEIEQLGPALLTLAYDAGRAVMAVYATEFERRVKDDHSPVTDADEAAEEIILAGLDRLTPGMPVIAEEMAAAGRLPAIGEGPFWLVDPLDGTREFIARNGEFTVNIALVCEAKPRLGVVLAPAQRNTAWLGRPGGAFRFTAPDSVGEPIAARVAPPFAAVALVSRSHREKEVEAWLARQDRVQTASVGSSLKFCRIAEGAADFYPRFASISEWDTAAGQAVLEAAGGEVVTWDGKPLTYGKPGFRNPGFLARGRS
jgi:3'(2'), 5'-bisphosphate nucleotidase